MSAWRSLTTTLPETFDERDAHEVAGTAWELRRVGSDTFVQIDGTPWVVELRGLAKLGELFPEPALALAGTHALLASPPMAYVAVGEGVLGIDDVTCGDYELTWFDLSDGRATAPSRVLLDGGEEVLHPPQGAGERVALLLRRTSM